MEENSSFIQEEESRQPAGGPDEILHPAFQPTEAKVRIVLLFTIAAAIIGSILGAMLLYSIAALMGWEMTALPNSLPADAPPLQRWQIRVLLGISHITTFILAGGAVVALFYRRFVPENPPHRWLTWRHYLGIHRLPSLRDLGLGILAMIVSAPLVLYAYELNRMFPLPEIVRQMEQQTNTTLQALLNMETPWELIANLVLIAFLPAVGEELMFRGILQQQLMRRLMPAWAALILSAAIFSFIHFQFEGFLPRMLLGFVLGWVYWRTHNLWVPVTAHFFNNAAQVAGQYLYKQKISEVNLEEDISVPWYVALFSLLTLIAVLRTFKRS